MTKEEIEQLKKKLKEEIVEAEKNELYAGLILKDHA